MWPETDFHFLRPLWLVFIPYAIWLHLRLRRAYSAARQWQGAIAPHLLAHLTVAGGRERRLRPYQLMTALLILTSVVIAGPTWEREITPFTQDRAPLVIAIELTPSMLCTDMQPTRLERARHKLRDLLSLRRGARTAVIVYAGSAHLLLPFTDDTELLEIYLESLHPNLMPTPGDEPTRALELAQALLRKETVPGTLLFLTDGIDTSHAESFANFTKASDQQLLVLGFGGDEGGPIQADGLDGGFNFDSDAIAPPLQRAALNTVAAAAGGRVVEAGLGSADITNLMSRIRRHLVDTLNRDKNLAWRDRGYPLVWLVAGCMLVWFRRGWTVQWRL
ncbi:MAG: Ca-activated chloride channel family protein [Myxococcota bacterium]|jgi:Ca-activated chloride channel family protein